MAGTDQHRRHRIGALCAPGLLDIQVSVHVEFQGRAIVRGGHVRKIITGHGRVAIQNPGRTLSVKAHDASRIELEEMSTYDTGIVLAEHRASPLILDPGRDGKGRRPAKSKGFG